jgi:hypothetical protein
MSKQPNLDERFKKPLYSMAKAIEMREVPLLVMSEADQWAFVAQATALLGGTVVYAAAQDAAQQILSSIVQRDYLFLIIEESLGKEVFNLIRYYLEARDVLGDVDTFLAQKYAAYPIHADHRLIQLIDREVLQQQPAQHSLLKLSTVIHVS